jgi:hypothetical protein
LAWAIPDFIEFRHGTQHLKRQSARWQRRVHCLFDCNQIHVEQSAFFRNGQQLFERAGQSIQGPYDYDCQICACGDQPSSTLKQAYRSSLHSGIRLLA